MKTKRYVLEKYKTYNLIKKTDKIDFKWKIQREEIQIFNYYNSNYLNFTGSGGYIYFWERIRIETNSHKYVWRKG